MDSKALVDMMLNLHNEEDGLSTLVKDCKFLASKLSHINFKHVFRGGNKYADFLTNLGQTGTWGTTFLEEPPNEIRGLLKAVSGGVGSRRIA